MRFNLSKTQHWILLIIFFLISFAVSKLLSEIITIKNVFIEIPGFFGIFGFLLWLFEKYIWKWKIFRFFKIIEFTNLEGKYKGSFTSSYKNPETGQRYKGDMELNIKQTASSVTIYGLFNESKSISTQATFGYNRMEQKICLYYFYRNKPEKNAVKTMHQHEGSAILCYNDKKKELEGEYYSGRDRNNFGDIKVTKQNK